MFLISELDFVFSCFSLLFLFWIIFLHLFLLLSLPVPRLSFLNILYSYFFYFIFSFNSLSTFYTPTFPSFRSITTSFYTPTFYTPTFFFFFIFLCPLPSNFCRTIFVLLLLFLLLWTEYYWSEFRVFFLLNWLPNQGQVKPIIYLKQGGGIDGFMPFPKIITQSEKQLVLSRIWTWFNDSIFNVDNQYPMPAPLSFITKSDGSSGIDSGFLISND